MAFWTLSYKEAFFLHGIFSFPLGILQCLLQAFIVLFLYLLFDLFQIHQVYDVRYRYNFLFALQVVVQLSNTIFD